MLITQKRVAEIVSRPEIDAVEIGKGKDFIYSNRSRKTGSYSGDYKGIEVEKKTVKVMAADVTAEIDKVLREQPYDYC